MRGTLALLVLGTLLPIVAMSVYLIYAHYRDVQQTLTQEAIARARAVSFVLDREFGAMHAALGALGTSPHLEHGDLSSLHAQALLVLRTMHAASIVMLAPDGQIVLSTLKPPGSKLPKVPSPKLLKKMLKTGQAGVSDLFPGPVSRKLIFVTGVPVMRDGVLRYALNATGSQQQILNILAEQKFPDKWRVLVADNNGLVVARTHQSETYFGRKLPSEVWQKISVKGSGSFESRSFDHVPVIRSYYRSAATGWTVSISVPRSEIRSGFLEALPGLILTALLALLAGLLTAWWIGGRIARSIHALVEPARLLGQGGQVAVSSLPVKEADEVAQALSEASVILRQSRHDALHDGLTGLPNRALLHSELEHLLSVSERRGTPLAILYIDLDGFKQVNDTLGHEAGDRLLCELSVLMQGQVRQADIVARLGGDEFAVVLLECKAHDAAHIADKIIDALSRVRAAGSDVPSVSASIGISLYPANGRDANTLLQKADEAMYAAKQAGKGRYSVFSD